MILITSLRVFFMYSCVRRDLLDSHSDFPYFCDLGREYPLLSATESGSDCVCSIPIAGAEEQNTVDGAERLSSVKESAKVVGQLCWLMPGSMLGSECCGSARECEA